VVNDITMVKENRRYLFFTKTADLFTALLKNKQLEITDEGSLIMPIEVIYEGKTYSLKMDFPIKINKFKSKE